MQKATMAQPWPAACRPPATAKQTTDEQQLAQFLRQVLLSAVRLWPCWWWWKNSCCWSCLGMCSPVHHPGWLSGQRSVPAWRRGLASGGSLAWPWRLALELELAAELELDGAGAAAGAGVCRPGPASCVRTVRDTESGFLGVVDPLTAPLNTVHQPAYMLAELRGDPARATRSAPRLNAYVSTLHESSTRPIRRSQPTKSLLSVTVPAQKGEA
jgi:hypothetical protein